MKLSETLISLASFFGLLAWGSLGLPAAGKALETDVRRDATVEAIEKVMPSVVNIGTQTIIETLDPFEKLFREWMGRGRQSNSQFSLGSGVIVDEEGYILTNDHVVRRANKIWVKLADGREFEATNIVTASRSDVALLKILAPSGVKFRPVKFAADDDLLLGETVLALGNPFGLGISVSRGILSSKTRRPPAENEPLGVEDWLQTDAAINVGNSGGPLINTRGELIGLNVAIYNEGQGIGFAIPIKRISKALTEIFTTEGLRSLWFGAQIKGASTPLVVSSLQPGSPAEKAGLRPDDILLQANGNDLKSFLELITELVSAGAGREIPLVFQRGSERRTISVRLVPENTVFNPGLIRQKLGVTLQQLTPELARSLGVNTSTGLIIAGVDRTGPGAEAELKRGFFIEAIDGQAADNLVTAAKILNPRKRGEKVRLQLWIPEWRGPYIRYHRGEAAVTVR